MMVLSCSPAVRWRALVATILTASTGVFADQSSEQGTVFYLYERFAATRNALGVIMRIDSTAGYNFNRYFAVDAGLPVYIVRPSETMLDTAAMQRATDIDNLDITARLTAAGPAITYLGTFTVTAPMGAKDQGLSTGKATYDWNNHLERSFGRATLFGDVGIANTITDTPFLIRPFKSQGLVTRFEGRARLRLARCVGAGALLYAIEPPGEQTVISRLVKVGASSPPPPGSPGNPDRKQPVGRGRKQDMFELNHTTVGPAEIARDRGGSLWLSFGPFRVLDLQVGYSRSATYALDTMFFGALRPGPCNIQKRELETAPGPSERRSDLGSEQRNVAEIENHRMKTALELAVGAVPVTPGQPPRGTAGPAVQSLGPYPRMAGPASLRSPGPYERPSLLSGPGFGGYPGRNAGCHRTGGRSAFGGEV